MSHDLAANVVAAGSVILEEAALPADIQNYSVRSAQSRRHLRLTSPRREAVTLGDLVPSAKVRLPDDLARPSKSKAASVDLADATVEAARVNWPVAERRDVTLVCCTQSSGAVADDLPQVRAAISALIAVQVNASLGGAVVTCSARMIEDEAVVSIVTTRCAVSLLDVAKALSRVQDERAIAPLVPGLGLELWRAIRLARMQGACLAFASQRNGNVAFALSFGKTRKN